MPTFPESITHHLLLYPFMGSVEWVRGRVYPRGHQVNESNI